jgi:hypothetical protein
VQQVILARGGSQATEASFQGAELQAVARRHGFDAWAEMAIVLTELSPGKIPTSDQLRDLNERLIGSKSSKATRLLMFNILVDLCAATGDVELAEHVLSPLLNVRDTMHRAELLRLQGSLMPSACQVAS